MPLCRQLVELVDAEQRHVDGDLFVQERDRACDECFAADRRRVDERPADEGEAGAEGERLEHVGAAPKAAVEQHRRLPADGDDALEHVQGRDGAVELPAAVVGDDDGVGAGGAGACRVVGVQQALQYQVAFPEASDALEVGPGEVAAVRVVAQHVAREDGRAARRVVVLEVRHAVAEQRLQEGAEQPARVRQALPGQRQVRPKGRVEAGPHVVLAVRGHRRVGGDHQRPETGPGDALDEGIDLCLIAGQVGLKPGAGMGLGDRLERDERRAADDHRYVGCRRSACHDDVAAIGRQGAQADGRDAERRGVGAAEERARLRAVRDIDQHPRQETEVVERGPVAPQRRLALRAADDVAEDRLGQMPSCRAFEVVEAEDVGSSKQPHV